jgi:hypothetical protein
MSGTWDGSSPTYTLKVKDNGNEMNFSARADNNKLTVTKGPISLVFDR